MTDRSVALITNCLRLRLRNTRCLERAVRTESDENTNFLGHGLLRTTVIVTNAYRYHTKNIPYGQNADRIRSKFWISTLESSTVADRE